MNVITTN